jgi:hypothetical protein
MPNTTHVDLDGGEEPLPGERFVILLQENSEMLGQLDRGRTFRFTSPTKVERDYQQENRALTVVDFDPIRSDVGENRKIGFLTYTA